MRKLLKSLGPGLLFAGAAIGVSHLVQSTRAGADFGFGLLWALLLINLVKYPSFQFGTRYAAATGKSLLDGYLGLGKWVLVAYFILSLLTMFTIQTAVTIVTAGLAVALFGIGNVAIWSVVITLICAGILAIGKFKILDHLMKVIIITLTISTVVAVIFAYINYTDVYQISETKGLSFKQVLPTDALGVAFLIAFMGWMPAPLDISVWQSLWTKEKAKTQKITVKNALLDFNIGYVGTVIIGLGFVTLGALVMYGSGETFSSSGSVFAGQLIGMYTASLGDWATVIIGIAAFTTMFSTTITTLDASPRAMEKTAVLLKLPTVLQSYSIWILVLAIGTGGILFFLINEMGTLVQIATVLSFLTAPLYALGNMLLFSDKNIPKEAHLSTSMKVYAWVSIFALVLFSAYYISTLF